MVAMATVTAAVEGADNNQPKEAAEETMVAVTELLAETMTARETATVAVTIAMLTPTLTTAHLRQQ